MKPFRLLRRNFEHGVHPAHHKNQTENLPIQRVPFVRDYVMPLGQHIGVPSRPVVAAGERVRRGQLIAEPGGFVSTGLHSPVTGTIKGDEVTLSIEVTAQGQDVKVDYVATVDGDSMAGKVLFGSFGEATFEGTREPPDEK